jgi:Kef-type K+ transport system membrane component KefB
MVHNAPQRDQPRRPQFGLRGLILFTTACSLLFAVFHWTGLSPRVSLLVGALLAASAVAALLLVLATTARSGDEKDEGE